MLKISLDESYVFDLLSIFEVKLSAAESLTKQEQLQRSYNTLREEIVDQVGIDLFNQIISSDQYNMLRKANQLVFDLVDRAHESALSKETADANYERYLRKVEIQTKFFTTQITEVKL